MNDDNRFALCLKEVDLVQGQIARYDSNGLTIKSWCLATCSVLAAYAVVHRSTFVAVIVAFVAVAFGSIELVYRCFQSRFISRPMELEAVLATGSLAAYRYALPSSALRARWLQEIRDALLLPHFSLLYAMLIVLALLLAFALRFGWVPLLPSPWATK